jgi:hypothetical protein
MVEISKNNINNKRVNIFKQNAKYIGEVDFLVKNEDICIVTE